MLQRITQGMLLFVTINTYEDEHKRILEFFSITESEPSGLRSWVRTTIRLSQRTSKPLSPTCLLGS